MGCGCRVNENFKSGGLSITVGMGVGGRQNVVVDVKCYEGLNSVV